MAGRTASQGSVVQDRYGVVEAMVEVGPGSMRVGRFIGRLGIVTMPVIERGLGLVDRVVRRHVAKLERVGWCARTPAIRGYGSLVWMTATGLAGVDLVDLRAVRAPDPFSIQTMRTVRLAWVAADIEAAAINGRHLASSRSHRTGGAHRSTTSAAPKAANCQTSCSGQRPGMRHRSPSSSSTDYPSHDARTRPWKAGSARSPPANTRSSDT